MTVAKHANRLIHFFSFCCFILKINNKKLNILQLTLKSKKFNKKKVFVNFFFKLKLKIYYKN